MTDNVSACDICDVQHERADLIAWSHKSDMCVTEVEICNVCSARIDSDVNPAQIFDLIYTKNFKDLRDAIDSHHKNDRDRLNAQFEMMNMINKYLVTK